MRSPITHILLGSLFLTSVFACAAPVASEDAPAGASAASEDPRDSLAKSATSVTLSENGKDSALGAPSKIDAVLATLHGHLTALPGTPRCGPPRLRMAFNGADAKKLATVNVCDADTAFLQVGTKWYEAPFAEPSLRKVFAAEPLVGDVLLPATEVVIGNTEGAGERMPATAYAKGLDLDAKPATRSAAEVPRCAPSMTLRFTTGNADVATVAVFCPKNENDTSAPATLTVKGELVGWITFDIAKALGSF